MKDEANKAKAVPAPELERLFAPRDAGYLGADVALSIPLSDGRCLWVFGDTLLGELTNGKRRIDSMLRNSVALQHPGDAVPENIEFILPEDWNVAEDFFRHPQKAAHAQWFWPTAGFRSGETVFIFGYGVEKAVGKTEIEALSFKLTEGWVMRIPDTRGHPSEWKIEAFPAPWPLGNAWFCSACLPEQDYLYLLGFDFDRLNLQSKKWAVMGRVLLSDLFREEAAPELEVRTPEGEWRAGNVRPARLYEPGVSETSLLYDAPRRRYLATAYPGSQPDFFITSADSLGGDWSPPVPIYRVPECDPPERYISYTLRFHPHLSSSADEMVLSYVTNPRAVADLDTRTDMYYPKFLTLDLNIIRIPQEASS